jgi:hypothetical protein
VSHIHPAVTATGVEEEAQDAQKHEGAAARIRTKCPDRGSARFRLNLFDFNAIAEQRGGPGRATAWVTAPGRLLHRSAAGPVGESGYQGPS